jgi:hypothetical protein
VEAGEAKSVLADARRDPLHDPGDRALEPTQVLAPVAQRPDLDPIHQQAVMASPRQTGCEKCEERRRRAMHHVVATPFLQQVAQDAAAELKRRANPTPAVDIEVEAWPNRNDAHTGNIGLVTGLPLAEGEVRDLIALLCKPLCEGAIPALAAADGIWIKAVVDETDAHEWRDSAAEKGSEQPRGLSYNARAVDEAVETSFEGRLAAKRRIAIVPALNEAETIARVIQEIRSSDRGFEILVVDDGSDDGTGEIAETAGARLLRLPFNLGIGGAVQTGYRYALANGFDIAVQIDGDGQHDPSQLRAILEPLVAGDADIVIGSRFAGVGGYRASRVRRFGMRVFARLVSTIVRQPLTDTSSSFRALNRRSLSLFSADYPHGFLETVEATVLAGKYRLRLKEVPVTMRERELGRSSLTIPLSLFYSAKVLLAVFVSLFRRPAVRLEEEP